MTIKSKIIPFTILTLGFVLGASALSTFAQFTPGPSSPPDCPLTIPGCNSPINTSSTIQVKNGILSLGADLGNGTFETFGLEILNGIRLIDGAVTPDTMILTSDSDGVGNWKPLPANIAAGYDTVTSEFTLTSANGAGLKKQILASSTPQYPLCYITQNKFSGGSAFINGCEVNIRNGNWVLEAYANAGGNESTTCSARCIGFAQPSAGVSTSCLVPKSEYKIGETIPWFASVVGGSGVYTYKFSSQAAASAAPGYSYLATNNTTGPITKAEMVTVLDQGGLSAGSAQCLNAKNSQASVTVLPTLYLNMTNANNTSGLVEGCPGPVSLTTSVSRTITGVTPAGVSISSRSWKLDGATVNSNTSNTYIFGGSITKKVYNLEHVVTASNGVVSSLMCPISII